MTPPLGMLASSWALTLARAAVEGGLFVVAVWSLCRLGWRLPAWLRTALWWTACLKLLVAPWPLAPFEVALRPSPATHALVAATDRGGWGGTSVARVPGPAAPRAASTPSPARAAGGRAPL